MIKELFIKYRGNKISKLKSDVDLIIQYRINILVLEKYSDKKLVEIDELSSDLYLYIFNNKEIPEILSNIKEIILQDEIFNKLICKRYLLLAYFSENLGYEKGIEEYLEEAKIRDSSIVKLNKDSFNSLEKELKKEKKDIKKQIKVLIEEKVERKKKKKLNL